MAANNDDMPQVVLEEWAASIRWLNAHPDALKGKRALSTMVASVVEGAREEEGTGAEGQGKEEAKIMIKKVESHERKFEFGIDSR